MLIHRVNGAVIDILLKAIYKGVEIGKIVLAGEHIHQQVDKRWCAYRIEVGNPGQGDVLTEIKAVIAGMLWLYALRNEVFNEQIVIIISKEIATRNAHPGGFFKKFGGIFTAYAKIELGLREADAACSIEDHIAYLVYRVLAVFQHSAQRNGELRGVVFKIRAVKICLVVHFDHQAIDELLSLPVRSVLEKSPEQNVKSAVANVGKALHYTAKVTKPQKLYRLVKGVGRLRAYLKKHL